MDSGATVVTGASGFIGRVLVRTLLDAGRPVVAVDRRPYPAVEGVTVLAADLLDGDPAVRAALRSASAVFHLAGCPGVRDGGADVAYRRRRDNPLAAAAVLDAVPRRTPVIVTSSSSVYGGTLGRGGLPRPSVETDPPRPRGGYAHSKVAVEAICAARLRDGGTVAVARPFTAAGEGQRPDMALARWIDAARRGRPLSVLGSPNRTRDVTDVRDVARALIALADERFRGPVNVGTGVGHTLRAMIDAVADVLGVPVTTFVTPAARKEVPATLADTTRLRRLTGVVAATDLRDVVRRQVAAGPPAGGHGSDFITGTAPRKHVEVGT